MANYFEITKTQNRIFSKFYILYFLLFCQFQQEEFIPDNKILYFDFFSTKKDNKIIIIPFYFCINFYIEFLWKHFVETNGKIKKISLNFLFQNITKFGFNRNFGCAKKFYKNYDIKTFEVIKQIINNFPTPMHTHQSRQKSSIKKYKPTHSKIKREENHLLKVVS